MNNDNNQNNENNNNQSDKIIKFDPNNLIPGINLNNETNVEETHNSETESNKNSEEESSQTNIEEKDNINEKKEEDSKIVSNDGLIKFNPNTIIPGVDLSNKEETIEKQEEDNKIEENNNSEKEESNGTKEENKKEIEETKPDNKEEIKKVDEKKEIINNQDNKIEVKNDKGITEKNINQEIKKEENNPLNIYALHGEEKEEEKLEEEKNKESIPLIDPKDEEYMKAFIANNYEKITKSKFSICAFFLGEIYYFYRKMFLYGIIIFVIRIILGMISPAIMIVLNIVLGIFTNKIYINYAQNKVDSYKLYNKDNIMELCKKNGGTSIIMVLISVITEVLLVFVMLFVFLSLGLSFGILALLSSFTSSNTKINTEYNGVLSFKTDININDYFELSMPQEFESVAKYQYNIDYEYISKKTSGFVKCEFTLGAVEDYTNSSKLINEMANFNDSNNTISTVKIKGITWNTFETTSGLGTSYYYATTKNGTLYLMEYDIGSDANKEQCTTFKKQIIDSINYK